MRYILFILFIGSLTMFSCHSTKQQNKQFGKDQLEVTFKINPIIESEDSFQLTFTVFNHSKETQKFCKWHTPFEKTMSKYLDIKDELGLAVDYIGPMAKRVMPPPADSYIQVLPGDSLQTTVNIFKDYKFEKAGKYTIHYNSVLISGLDIKDSISFTYKK